MYLKILICGVTWRQTHVNYPLDLSSFLSSLALPCSSSPSLLEYRSFFFSCFPEPSRSPLSSSHKTCESYCQVRLGLVSLAQSAAKLPKFVCYTERSYSDRSCGNLYHGWGGEVKSNSSRENIAMVFLLISQQLPYTKQPGNNTYTRNLRRNLVRIGCFESSSSKPETTKMKRFTAVVKRLLNNTNFRFYFNAKNGGRQSY